MRPGLSAYVVGLILIAISISVNPDFNGSSHTYDATQHTQLKNGLYVTEIPNNFTARQVTEIILFLRNDTASYSNYSLMPSKELINATFSNYQALGLNGSINDGNGDIYYYAVPAGTYAFAEAQPYVVAVIVQPQLQQTVSGYTGTPGLIATGIGLLLILVSAANRRKRLAK